MRVTKASSLTGTLRVAFTSGKWSDRVEPTAEARSWESRANPLPSSPPVRLSHRL
jgi:hypothetical protein